MKAVFQLSVVIMTVTATASPLADRLGSDVVDADIQPAVSLSDMPPVQSFEVELQSVKTLSCMAQESVGGLDVFPVTVSTCEISKQILPSQPVLSSGFPVASPIVMPTFGDAEVMGISDVDDIFSLLVYRGIANGSISNRTAQWRPILLRRLVSTPRGVRVDDVLMMLLSTFPGGDDNIRIPALRRWLSTTGDVVAVGDALRALTRFYINAGRYEDAVSTAREMAKVRPEYGLRAYSLQGYALAFSGDYEEAKSAIRAALTMNPTAGERARLDFLSAWIILQEGDVDKAVPLLRTLAYESFGEFANRARKILESLNEEN